MPPSASNATLPNTVPPTISATIITAVKPTTSHTRRCGLHIDLVRGPHQLEKVLKNWPIDRMLSLGVIDGRNIWRADLAKALNVIDVAIAARGRETIQIAPSCSLIHSPVDLESETKLDAELKSWLAYAKQKLGEVSALKTTVTQCRGAAAQAG